MTHRWRHDVDIFDGKKEFRAALEEVTGEEILQQLESVPLCSFGKTQKKRKRADIELSWTKSSIFFELPYWSKLKLRHNLDVMHVEKNICDNVLGTLMNVDGKTKDNSSARRDLALLGIRKDLHLQVRGQQ